MSTKQEIITKEEAEVSTLPAPASDSSSIMAIIDRAATDPNFDADKLGKLLDVAERWEANEARKAFMAARAAFKAEAPTILKNKHVGFETSKGRTDYDHATLDNVADVLSPILSKHGLSYGWDTDVSDNGQIRVTCVLSHVQGHSQKVTLPGPPDASGGKNGIQAIGSTVTYLERYTLLAVCGIATKGQDDDGFGGSGETITPEQVEILTLKTSEVGADPDKFLAYMGVEAWTDIPAGKFNDALKALERKRQKGADNG